MAEDILLPGLHDGGLSELVVGVDEQTEGAHNETDGAGGVEAEGFVGNDAHLRHLCEEMTGDEGNSRIGSYQDGDAALADALGHEGGDDLGRLVEDGFLVVIARQEPDVDMACCLLGGGNLLLHIGIGAFQLFGLVVAEFFLGEVFEFGSMAEEGIVEFDDTSLGTVVRTQVAGLDLLFGELVLDAVEQSPVARAPTVDALLDVAYDEIGGVLVAHGLGEQYVEVTPLDGRGVLKLVNHHVLYLGANLLEDERRIALTDERVEQLLSIAEQEAVVEFVELVYLFLDAAEQA